MTLSYNNFHLSFVAGHHRVCASEMDQFYYDPVQPHTEIPREYVDRTLIV